MYQTVSDSLFPSLFVRDSCSDHFTSASPLNLIETAEIKEKKINASGTASSSVTLTHHFISS